MNITANGLKSALARVVLIAIAGAALASCGSGAVSGPPPAAGTLSLSPANATLYSGLPTTFTVTGGSGTYTVISSNQAVVSSIQAISANTFTVIPLEVSADTSVALTVQDTSSSAPATAALTVKPRTVSNVVTITPSFGQPAVCGNSICSGGDAEVKVTIAVGGVPLVSRPVRFDVLSGDLRIIVSGPGVAEVLGTSTTVATDGTGTARIRVRVLADAASQTALIQVTDQSSGFVQTATVPIAAASSAPLTAQPSQLQFTGPNSSSCATGISADVLIAGGRPPYQVTQPAGFLVSPLLLGGPGRVTVTANGQCARTGVSTGTTQIPDAGQVMAIVDGNGASTSVTIHNDPAPVTPQTSPFDASPTSVTLDSCAAIANIALVGGSGSYFAASGNTAVDAFAGGRIGTIRRRAGSSATSISQVTVAFSDGQTVKNVAVTLSPAAMGPCL